MPSGHRPRSARATPSDRAPFGTPATAAGLIFGLMLSVALNLALGGCATGGRSSDSAVERRAALDRWSRCVERQSHVATLSEVRTRLERGCEGYRRDVLRTFPPHMEPRLERLMDKRTNAVLRMRLRGDGALRDGDDPTSRDVIDTISPG